MRACVSAGPSGSLEPGGVLLPDVSGLKDLSSLLAPQTGAEEQKKKQEGERQPVLASR